MTKIEYEQNCFLKRIECYMGGTLITWRPMFHLVSAPTNCSITVPTEPDGRECFIKGFVDTKKKDGLHQILDEFFVAYRSVIFEGLIEYLNQHI